MTNTRETAPRVLVADDDRVGRHFLVNLLREWGYSVEEAADGGQAWRRLEAADRPGIALLDWSMPELDGIEICERVRSASFMPPPYLIMVTGREQQEDLIAGLESGADDYIVKPVHPGELRARLAVARRMSQLQSELVARVRELEAAQAQVRQLHEILPICSVCRKIRDDEGAYHQLEGYISRHTNTRFSHGYCPDCAKKVMDDIDAADGRA